MKLPGSAKDCLVLHPNFLTRTQSARACAATLFSLLIMPACLATATSKSHSVAALEVNYGKLPLSFEANYGQTDSQVRFLSHGNGYSIYLTDRSAVLTLQKGKKNAGPAAVIRMDLAGTKGAERVDGLDELPGKANYFVGNDPSAWKTDVSTYGRVKYSDVYPGVDLVYYGNQRQLEYDFVLAPGARPEMIRLHISGDQKLRVLGDGSLAITAKSGQIAFRKPELYQMRDGKREAVKGSFRLLSAHEVGFTVGSFDRSRELVIDPVLAYATYLGGSGGDGAAGIAVDAVGNAYVVGGSCSDNFPITLKGYTKTPGDDVFVAKFNANGTQLLYSACLGGNGGSGGNAIAVDAQGNAYVTGGTYATNFPTSYVAYMKHDPAANYVYGEGTEPTTFVTKLNATGSALVYSTYLGGTGVFPAYYPGVIYFAQGDVAHGIAVDSAGSAYVVGFASSLDFPVTSGAFQTTNKGGGPQTLGTNAFVSKFNPEGSALVYSTFLGGSAGYYQSGSGGNVNYYSDGADAIAVGESGDAYVTGQTYSSDFPITPNAFQQVNHESGNQTVFVSELNPAGSDLVYSTFLGGSGAIPEYNYDAGETGNAIAIDSAGDAYVTGFTNSGDFPVTPDALQSVNEAYVDPYDFGTNAFVSELNATGSALVYSTYLGGTDGADQGTGIGVNSTGDAFVSLGSYDLPVTPDALESTPTGAYLAEINPTGTAILYSSYVGGSNGGNGISGLTLDSGGNVYVAGATSSTNLPVTGNAYQRVNKAAPISAGNAFVAKFDFSTPIATKTTVTSNKNPAPDGFNVTFTALVQPKSGDGIPTGLVTFSLPGQPQVNVALDDTGHATYKTTTPLNPGYDNVKAGYAGDPHYAPSVGSIQEAVLTYNNSFSWISSDGQEATYGSYFAQPLVGRLVDGDGIPVPGASVALYPSTNATGVMLKVPQSAITNADGEISISAEALAAGHATLSDPWGAVLTLNELPAPLTVTARNVSVPYGKPIPPLTYSVTGFVNKDTSSIVEGAPTETTTATVGSPAGTYPITLGVGTLKARYYNFHLENGTLTITPADAAAEPAF